MLSELGQSQKEICKVTYNICHIVSISLALKFRGFYLGTYFVDYVNGNDMNFIVGFMMKRIENR